MNSRTKGKTFIIRIYHTERGTWQGKIGNVKIGNMQSFQSCLEMIKILDSQLANVDVIVDSCEIGGGL